MGIFVIWNCTKEEEDESSFTIWTKWEDATNSSYVQFLTKVVSHTTQDRAIGHASRLLWRRWFYCLANSALLSFLFKRLPLIGDILCQWSLIIGSCFYQHPASAGAGHSVAFPTFFFFFFFFFFFLLVRRFKLSTNQIACLKIFKFFDQSRCFFFKKIWDKKSRQKKCYFMHFLTKMGFLLHNKVTKWVIKVVMSQFNFFSAIAAAIFLAKWYCSGI